MSKEKNKSRRKIGKFLEGDYIYDQELDEVFELKWHHYFAIQLDRCRVYTTPRYIVADGLQINRFLQSNK
jgi:hypothetical protein